MMVIEVIVILTAMIKLSLANICWCDAMDAVHVDQISQPGSRDVGLVVCEFFFGLFVSVRFCSRLSD